MAENNTSTNGQVRVVGADSERVRLEHIGASKKEQDFIDSLSANMRTLLYISDELRGPLALFQGYLSMVEDGDLPLQQALPLLMKASRDMNKKLAQMLIDAKELIITP